MRSAWLGLRPEIYESWDVRRLGAELRERGLQTVQVYREVDGKNQRGLDRADLEKALTEARPKVEITA